MKISMTRVSDLCVVALCVTGIAQMALQFKDRAEWRANRRPASTAPARSVALYQPGDASPAMAGVSYTEADRTLLMFVRSGCSYCTASMPFYSRLQEARSKANTRVRLVAVSPDAPDVLSAYLQSHGISVDRSVSLPPAELSRLKVSGTPTLVLADQRGKVRNSWTGLIPEGKEADVIGSIVSPTPK